MSKNTRKDKPASIITSPDGIRIQITAGNKWKFTRAVQRDKTGRYSKLQKDIMIVLIDKTDEGYDADRSKWGHAYPSFEYLAAECGCTPEAVKKNIPKLEKKKVLTVTRSAGKRASGKKGLGGGGGRDKSNRYFLHDWNVFGRVGNGEPAETKYTKEGLLSASWMNKQIHGFDDSEAENESGVLVNYWHWNEDEFQPAIDALGFDEYELDEEIDIFTKQYLGERKHDWSSDWLSWIKTPEVHARQRERVRQRAAPDLVHEPAF